MSIFGIEVGIADRSRRSGPTSISKSDPLSRYPGRERTLLEFQRLLKWIQSSGRRCRQLTTGTVAGRPPKKSSHFDCSFAFAGH